MHNILRKKKAHAITERAPRNISSEKLKPDFDSQLHLAWIVPSVDGAKCGPAPDVSVNPARIAMIECVESLKPKLQTHAFAEVDVLHQRDIP
jgi:hypothetical protein